MGVTVYAEDDKIHFDLNGEHSESIRIYDFEAGDFVEKTVSDVRSEYSHEMQKEFFAELLRYTQGQFTKSGSDIIYECSKTPLGAVFKIADRQENEAGDVANVSLSTVGSITYEGKNILNISNERNTELYSHFVRAMNNRVDTADLF